MKKLLLVILLSATIDAKTDTTLTSGGDLESDYSERQVWWKREKRKDDARKSGTPSDPSEIFFSSPFTESIHSSVLSTLIRYLDMNGRPGPSQDLRKSIVKEYLRYRIANSKPETDKGYLKSCDSKECYRQGWEIQKPFYVDEPSWIKIDNDLSKTRSIHRLDVTDPFVISRGKKIHGVDHLETKRANIYALVRDRFAEERKLKFENEKADERSGENEENKRQVSKNTTERENVSEELSKHRAENEIRFRSSKFHPGDRSIESDESDSVLFLDGKRDRNFADVRNRLGANRCLPFEPCYPTDKMDARLDYEKPKSKRISNSDSDLDSSIDRSVAKDLLESLIDNLECDSIQCTDQSGRTTKRTRLADGRGILEHLLAKSDPFYVARGKRVSRNFSPESVDIYDRNL